MNTHIKGTIVNKMEYPDNSGNMKYFVVVRLPDDVVTGLVTKEEYNKESCKVDSVVDVILFEDGSYEIVI